ncbi:MAG: isoprenylcysteine carboxylmethyltransferase family protein, partial [Anaerolineae bacterium]|nr:isoprenylcysteine carboxylmethyltransferase family protein [Anaerolineae bacterium]
EFLGLKQLYTKPSDQPGTLSTSGLYRYMRHPLYTFGLLFIWFTPIMTLNLFALYLSITLYIIVGAVFEERRLVAELGEAYSAYQSRTSFLIPWPPKSP